MIFHFFHYQAKLERVVVILVGLIFYNPDIPIRLGLKDYIIDWFHFISS
jgi:hypothetical protein